MELKFETRKYQFSSTLKNCTLKHHPAVTLTSSNDKNMKLNKATYKPDRLSEASHHDEKSDYPRCPL